MSYYKFARDDIIDVVFETRPLQQVELNGNQVTGSVRLEKRYLDSTLEQRIHQGVSQKEGGLIEVSGPVTASIDIRTAQSGGTNSELWFSVFYNLYPDYKIRTNDYQTSATTLRVIEVPSIYYDRAILTGSFTASDLDSAGDARALYDNGRGGIYSGSVTGSLVGNIFYESGMAVLTATNLTDFGGASPTNFKWRVHLKGVHRIPTKIFKCRAPAGELNASTNPTFYQTPTTGDYKNEKQAVLGNKETYVTTIGLYNEQFELVGMVRVAQPIKKTSRDNILFRVRLDW